MEKNLAGDGKFDCSKIHFNWKYDLFHSSKKFNPIQNCGFVFFEIPVIKKYNTVNTRFSKSKNH
ncbi:mannose/fructose/N-acetylgalactosamine-specific phosphotransferase system component IID [Algoriphagus iocasae]|uniref:Mannose/fructose/N-acetylgalactosamine-specific phosphotransferase system component IID n=1 Tax=Algoriphagus iocasae TaxID=1836499 RepID=A0A841MNF7_9BACT|nr:mannose/fructose/N-acetylgalactosamine-specific phosphotransferase system component IID [Algoriphagus iocasae]